MDENLIAFRLSPGPPGDRYYIWSEVVEDQTPIPDDLRDFMGLRFDAIPKVLPDAYTVLVYDTCAVVAPDAAVLNCGRLVMDGLHYQTHPLPKGNPVTAMTVAPKFTLDLRPLIGVTPTQCYLCKDGIQSTTAVLDRKNRRKYLRRAITTIDTLVKCYRDNQFYMRGVPELSTSAFPV